MESPHHIGVRELNVSNWHAHNGLNTFNHAVPAIKTSAAFFTFLRANLVLNPSAMSSNTSTPVLQPTGASRIPTHRRPSSPSPLADSRTLDSLDDDDDDVPPLSLEVLSSRADKAAALHLIADSIAQQRQTASFALVSHPVPLAALVLALGTAYRLSHGRGGTGDLGTTLTLFSGVFMTYLLAIRYAASGYIALAEAVSWSFIRPVPEASPNEEDLILGARFGGDVIAALVLRLEPAVPVAVAGVSGGGGRRRNKASFRGGKGLIRAWTTRLRFRGRGVGADLLHEAVRITRERCGKDAEVGFALEHANSRMVLPEFFNGVFRKRERWAAKTLDAVLAEREASKKKR